MKFHYYLVTVGIMFLSFILPTPVRGLDIQTYERTLSNEVLENHSNKGFHILGVIELANVSAGLHPVSEFSGLTWDNDDRILYVVSDQGYLLHLNPVFEGGRLADVLLTNMFPLKDRYGHPLAGKFVDSEGLEAINQDNGVRGDTELLISFERDPRIDRYLPNGRNIGAVEIPGFLTTISNYDNANSSLESVTVHKQYGIITAPEKLSSAYPVDEFQLYSVQGQKWTFNNSGGKDGAIVGMTTTATGNILALERIFANVFTGIRFTLHHVVLVNGSSDHEILVRIGPESGYFNDNFEGIAHHEGNRYFMISDDNRNPIQRSLLVYFELPE